VDIEIECPYCGELVTIFIDPGGGEEQLYVEDCPVCCRPWKIAARQEEEGGFAVAVVREDD
jgi:hypothetical protein